MEVIEQKELKAIVEALAEKSYKLNSLDERYTPLVADPDFQRLVRIANEPIPQNLPQGNEANIRHKPWAELVSMMEVLGNLVTSSQETVDLQAKAMLAIATEMERRFRLLLPEE